MPPRTAQLEEKWGLWGDLDPLRSLPPALRTSSTQSSPPQPLFLTLSPNTAPPHTPPHCPPAARPHQRCRPRRPRSRSPLTAGRPRRHCPGRPLPGNAGTRGPAQPAHDGRSCWPISGRNVTRTTHCPRPLGWGEERGPRGPWHSLGGNTCGKWETGRVGHQPWAPEGGKWSQSVFMNIVTEKPREISGPHRVLSWHKGKDHVFG